MPSGGHPHGNGAACGTQKYTAGNASAYIPEAYEGSIPIRLSYEKFLAILQKALNKIGATDIKYLEEDTEAQFRTPEMQEGMIGTISITNIYEKRKFLRPYDCLQMPIHTLWEPLEFYTSGPKADSEPPSNLFLTIKTHNFTLVQNGADLHGPFDASNHVLARPFRSNSSGLYTAIVVGMQEGKCLTDIWIRSATLKRWNITEDEAFDLAIKNVDRITPKKAPVLARHFFGGNRRRFSFKRDQPAFALASQSFRKRHSTSHISGRQGSTAFTFASNDSKIGCNTTLRSSLSRCHSL
jgi:hypothetical protein